jgi:hypothetical protein
MVEMENLLGGIEKKPMRLLPVIKIAIKEIVIMKISGYFMKIIMFWIIKIGSSVETLQISRST